MHLPQLSDASAPKTNADADAFFKRRFDGKLDTKVRIRNRKHYDSVLELTIVNKRMCRTILPTFFRCDFITLTSNARYKFFLMFHGCRSKEVIHFVQRLRCYDLVTFIYGLCKTHSQFANNTPISCAPENNFTSVQIHATRPPGLSLSLSQDRTILQLPDCLRLGTFVNNLQSCKMCKMQIMI